MYHIRKLKTLTHIQYTKDECCATCWAETFRWFELRWSYRNKYIPYITILYIHTYIHMPNVTYIKSQSICLNKMQPCKRWLFVLCVRNGLKHYVIDLRLYSLTTTTQNCKRRKSHHIQLYIYILHERFFIQKIYRKKLSIVHIKRRVGIYFRFAHNMQYCYI